MATESPKYEVLHKESHFEIRRYAPYIVAETVVEGSFDDVSTIGFRTLASYIFGGNTSKQKIAMTKPVGLEKKSEKIEMTSPVGQEPRDGKYVITFSMPSQYILESLPTPDNKSITLKEVSEKKLAVIEFSGLSNQSKYESELQKLKDWIILKKFKMIGEPTYARYDPPWTLWFMRRNEILIEISGDVIKD